MLSCSTDELCDAFDALSTAFYDAFNWLFDMMEEVAENFIIPRKPKKKNLPQKRIGKPRPAAANLFLIQAKKCNRLPRSDMTGVSVRQTL